jgi:hypothetical protein
VEVPSGLKTIEVEREGRLLNRTTVSAHAPRVRVLSPNGGESVSDPFVINWQASDADGDHLTYMVQYSSYGGGNWQVLATNAPTPTYSTTVASLAGGTRSLVRVIANDGVLTGSDESDGTFRVPKHAPLVFMYTEDGARFDAAHPVVLEGGAVDNEDGRLSGQDLQWWVSPGGRTGSGDTLTMFNMVAGDYRASLTATDSDGQAARETIDIRVHGEAVFSRTFLPMALKH